MAAVRSLRLSEISALHKGFAPNLIGMAGETLIASRPFLFSASFVPPIMVLKEAALEHNIAVMASYCRNAGVQLAPHGKTTLCPQIIGRQLDVGAWGITVATPSQVALCRTFGVQKILLANELADRTAVSWIASELQRDKSFEFLCYVDSVSGVELLVDTLSSLGHHDRPLEVLVEVGHRDGRTGVRDIDGAIAVAKAVNQATQLSLRGVSGYEGGIGHDASSHTLTLVAEYLRYLRKTAERLIELRLLTPSMGRRVILSAGGSAYFDVVVDELRRGWSVPAPVDVILRSGSYVTHDSGLYERLSPFTRFGGDLRLASAIEVWGSVLSRPERELALVGAGKRDLAFDEGLPTLVGYRRNGRRLPLPSATVTRLNDQHAFVAVQSGSDVEVADWVGFGISHPCTALDKWRFAPVVDDDYRVVDLYDFCF